MIPKVKELKLNKFTDLPVTISGLGFQTDSLKGFALADESKQFKWATSKISGNKVLLRTDIWSVKTDETW